MWEKIKPWFFVPGFLAIVSALIRYSLDFVWDAESNWLIGIGVALILLSVALNWENSRRFYKRRSTVYLTFSMVSATVLLGILFLINFIVWLHPAKYDLTEKSFFTLSEQSRKILANLEQDIRVLAFYKDTEKDPQLEYLLRLYHQSSNRLFEYRFVDPDRDPGLTSQYGVTRYKTVIMESGDKRLRVEEPSEKDLTNTILKLSQGSPKTVYFLTGHGEHDYDSVERSGYSRAKRALEESNYQVELLNLQEMDHVPEACAVLIVAGARSTPIRDEMEKITAYLEGGGSLLLLLDPEPRAGLGDFLVRYGVRVGNDIVIDASGASRAIGAGPDVPLIENYFRTEITSPLTPRSFYPRARSLTLIDTPSKDLEVVSLMQTSRSSWGETEMGPEGGTRYDEEKDLKGPIALAVKITKTLPSRGKARMVVFGDSDFSDNVYFDQQGNGDLFLNSVNWLADNTDLIAIRPKKPENRRLNVTARTNKVIFYICLVFMPALPLSAGVWVFFRRFK